MRITYVGHACLLVEGDGFRILMDPWIHGPSQAHAWWHVPPAAFKVEDLGKLDMIMISHVHDDHFHLPTLELLPKNTPVIVPYSLDPWMAQTLRGMGFTRVLELEHDRVYRFAKGLVIKNFHHGRIDSAYWLKQGVRSLLNLNDCPVSTSWSNAWRSRHPAPDFAFGAFSYASPYPVCYELPDWDKEEVIRESRRRVLEQFASTMTAIGPQTAIPFATQYGFLAPDQLWMNAYTPSPLAALKALETRRTSVRGVLLNPGDSLAAGEDPRRTGSVFDWANYEESVRVLSRQHTDRIAQAFKHEKAPDGLLFDAFRMYFTKLLRHNRIMRRRVGIPVAFVLQENSQRWTVDFSRRSDWVVRETETRASVEIHLPSALLFEAVCGRVHWETVYLSNRLRIVSITGRLNQEWNMWRMLFNFPEGILKDRMRFLTFRGMRILWRRRDEIGDLVRRRWLAASASRREPYDNENRSP